MDRPSVLAINRQILTSRLLLEPLTGDHADLMFDALQDPAIYEWISSCPPRTRNELESDWLTRSAKLSEEREVTYFNWAVRRIADDRLLGTMDAEVTSNFVATNIGYVFLPTYWRQGYATEALVSLSRHLASHGVLRQTAVVTLGNDASMVVLGRAGFLRSRTIPENDVIRGKVVDDVEYVYSHLDRQT
jgi:[ribosomal protein S5]-alanine N-acetyltransferase